MPKVRGDSGTDMTQATDDKVTIVGSSPNLYPSCRVDGAGKSKIDISSSESEGMMEMETARSEYEAIDNSGDHHGGSYTIVAMNKFSIDAAGGGINLNSSGNISLMGGGGLVNIVGTEAVNAIAKTVSFTAAEMSVFEGPELYINTENTTFVNNVRLAKNLLVKGSTFVNGELYVNHITGPHQVMDTSSTNVLPVFFNNAATLSGIINATYTCSSSPVATEGGPAAPPSGNITIMVNDFILDTKTTSSSRAFIRPHFHSYRHVAVDFKEGNADVWAESAGLNTNEAKQHKPTENYGAPLEKVMMKKMKKVLNDYVDSVAESMK